MTITTKGTTSTKGTQAESESVMEKLWNEGVAECERVFISELTEAERQAVLKYYGLTGGSGKVATIVQGGKTHRLGLGGKVCLAPVKAAHYALAPVTESTKPDEAKEASKEPVYKQARKQARKESPAPIAETPAPSPVSGDMSALIDAIAGRLSEQLPALVDKAVENALK